MNTPTASLINPSMLRMMEKYKVLSPAVDTFIFNHRLSPEKEQTLWESVKNELNHYPGNFQSLMKGYVEKHLVRIFAKTNVGTSYDYTFFLHGYECSLVWKNYDKKNQEAYYEAWNPHQGTYYKRNLLELEMKTA